MRFWISLMLLGILGIIGCSADESRRGKRDAKNAASSPERAADKPAGENAPNPLARNANNPVSRKIIYDGTMEIDVVDFDASVDKLQTMIREVGGYVSESQITGRQGERRSGRWIVRIPVAKFDSFRDSASELGELHKNTLKSDDVTDRYFDLAAEVTNLEAREKALRKLYEEKIAGSKLSDLIEVDRELSKVRGEINQRKGQLQRWDNLTEFATLTILFSELRSYEPTTQPGFLTTLNRTFFRSIRTMVEVGKTTALVVTALSPWLVVAFIVFLPLYLRFFRRSRTPPPVPPGN